LPLHQLQQPKRLVGPGHVYWGLGQVWLGLGVALGLNLVVSLIALGIWLVDNIDSLSPGNLPGNTQTLLSDLTASPVFVLVSLLTLWFGFLLGVFVASYRNGQRSLALDFGWRFVWRTDLALGIGLAIVLRLADWAFGSALTALGVNPKSLDNSGPILDQKGVALVVIVIAASVGAPIVEELFFRGLTLRALQKRWGAVVGIIGSSVLFGLLHAQPDSSGALTFSSLWLVLFTASLGAVLAWVAVKTNRLGITVIAHMTFNLSALLLALIAS
jgi:membrane protease YdiL (CAAX protease family)